MKMIANTVITSANMNPSYKDQKELIPSISIVDEDTGDSVKAICLNQQLVEIGLKNKFKPCEIVFEYNQKYGSIKVVEIRPLTK